jgi:Ca-activated chloride channel family protein
MKFIWPYFLLLLLILPLITVGYFWLLNRRKRFVLNFSSLEIIREAQPGQGRLLRHLPFLFFLLAILSLIIALARPTAQVPMPSGKPTVVLALDVSLSMCANDILPNRLTVAQEAAESFIRNQHTRAQIALVAFAGWSELVVPPTEDPEILIEAVDNLTTAPRTAIGSAILRSINAIAETNEQVSPTDLILNLDEAPFSTAQAGELQPDIIVLLTDGASNRGADPVNAAQVAVNRGLRVYTIGFGTPEGARFFCTREQLGEDRYSLAFGGQGGFFGGGGNSGFTTQFDTSLDEDTLREVAELTQAEFFIAESADELMEVFATVPANLGTIKVTVEVSVLFTSLAALNLLIAFVYSRRWNPLP